MAIKYEKKKFKSILNTFKFIDSWFWCKYSLNPYNGCEFACTYCDSRSHKYHLHSDFDQTVIVKENVKEMLDNRLSRARTLLPDIVAISGSCDPYQNAEKKFENTRQCLEVLVKHNYPVNISTKSTFVTRDIELLSTIGKYAWCAVSITITTNDDKLSGFLEPNAPVPAKRFETIKELKKNKYLQVGVNLMPIVPFLYDSEENLEELIRLSKDAGADYILFGPGMTMRDNQAAWFFKRLNDEYPDLVEKYLKLYNAELTPENEYKGSYGPSKSYSKKITKKILELCEKYDLSYRMKRFIPDDFRKLNYMISEEFLNEAYVLQFTGKPWTNLFWAGQNIQNLKVSIAEIANRNDLQSIRNVNDSLEKRINEFISKQNIKSSIQSRLGTE
jgi:DNA repair photolyase